jgi:S-formylglutathione hydrolase FrmB
MRRRRRRTPRGGPVLALLLGALAACAVAPVAWANSVVEFEVPARGGEITDRWYGYKGAPRARAILPDNYDPAKAYPLLIILPGLSNTYSWWTEPGRGNVAKTVAGLDAIVVTPEGGTGGWYTDWWNRGRRGGPAWESYLLDQVIPQVQERFRIRPERRYHALSGGSMGGLGAAYLGGRLPGYFGAVVVLSGFVDTQIYPGVNWGQSLISGAPDPIDPELVYGPLGGYYATAHNPTRLAANLAQSRVFMASGNGLPSPVNSGTPLDQILEPVFIRPMSDSYAAALRRANVDLTYQVHSGYHDWANMNRELRDAIAWGLFAPVDEDPTSWVNDTVATHGRLWQLTYRFDAPPDRIVRFRRSGGRLSVSAAGSPVTLTTDGGCVVHLTTPGAIDIPTTACTRLAVSVSPRRLRAGRWTTVRLAVTPAVAGTVLSAGRRSAQADTAGVASLRLCAGTARGVGVTVTAPGFPRTRVTVPGRGRARTCRTEGPSRAGAGDR